MRQQAGFITASFCIVLSIAFNANAATTVYTSRAAFNAATTNQQTIDFNGLAALNGATNFNSPVNTLTTGGVTFTDDGPSATLYVIDTGYGGGAYFFNGGGGPYLNNNNYYTGSSPLTTLTATLPANVSAVGGDFGLQRVNTATTKITIGLSTGEQFTFDPLPASPSFNFLGFVSNQTLTSLTFQATASVPGQSSTGSPSLDNFTLAKNAAPEPATIGLLMSAAAIACGARRRTRSE